MKNPVKNYYFRTETNQRENNEDSLDRADLSVTGDVPMTILSIADGMGGYEHGEDVSREGLRQFNLTLRGEIAACPPLTIEHIKQALIVALQQAHDRVCQMVATHNWHKSGATIVAAVIWQDRLVVANLGDSPLFHYHSQTGELVKVTLDHSVAGILAQAGIITAEMARHHERRGQLEYYLGCPAIPHPIPVADRELSPGDLVMLCSDGISGLLSLAQIRQILARTDTSLEQKADALILTARAAGETDNQTLIFWCQPGTSAHKQPDRAQDLITIDSSSPRGREIDRQLDKKALLSQSDYFDSGSPKARLRQQHESAQKAPNPDRQHRPIPQQSAARTAIWSIGGGVLTLAAVALVGWNTGLVRTVEVLKSLPQQVKGWLNDSPTAVPQQPEVPKKLDPREPLDIIERASALSRSQSVSERESI